MKIKILGYLLLFSQIILSQEKQFIEVEVTNKHYVDALDQSSGIPCDGGEAYIISRSSGRNREVSSIKTILIFDLNGKIQQRKGYKIKKNCKSNPQDLIEIYNYSNNGLLSTILEQEKVNKNLIEKTFLQQFYYNDKKQLIEKTFQDLKTDSIVKRITYEYDANGNNTKMICDSLHYIIKEYDSNNKIVSATQFNDKNIYYLNDEEVKVGYSLFENSNKMNKVTFSYTKQNYNNGLLKENEQSNESFNFKKNKKYAYMDNDLLKSYEVSNSFVPDNYMLNQKLTVKSDFKDWLNRKVIETINNQICTSDVWE